ncbi:MAG TPA: GGDEF domain-containing protein [Thiotrichales bacterium]|nr:GGDEF domain-containing protein [Thiotrichales bacterium]
MATAGPSVSEWKQKYFDTLGELEEKEKRWESMEQALRLSLSRFSVALEGIHEELDRDLEHLRSRLRKGESLRALQPLVDTIVRKLDRYDTPGGRQEEETKWLETLLDQVPWPDSAQRSVRAIRQTAAQGGAGQAIEPLRALLADLLRDAPPAKAPEPHRESPRQGGLLGRLLGGRKGEEGGETGELNRFLERIHPPAAVEEGFRSACRRLREVTESRIRLSVLDHLASLLNQALAATERLSLNEALLQLMERLSLPAELQQAADEIRHRLEREVREEEWPEVLEGVAELIATLRSSIQREKKDLEQFLAELADRLDGIDSFLTNLQEGHRAGLEGGRSLTAAVQENVEGIRRSFAASDDPRQLKLAVQERLAAIDDHLARFIREEESRSREAEAAVEELNRRLHLLEEEAAHLRSRIGEERRLAMVDGLTGLPNRMAWDERVDEEFARWQRFGQPLSLLVIDIDHFKRINDSYGHQAGDRVLKTIAQRLREQVRTTDFMARYGGEEFVLLMPGADIRAAFEVAEKLRQRVADSGFHYRGERVPVTISGGLAQFFHGDTPETVFERADKALYRAKNEGRNRCIMAD